MSVLGLLGAMEGHAVVVAENVERDERWLALRRNGIGGSDAAVVAGQSRWAGPFELYLRKRGELAEIADNDAMMRGRDLEPVIAGWFAREAGLVLCNPRVLLRSTRWPWMLATPDRLVGTSISEATAGVEIKATSDRRATEWEDGDAPAEARLQCVHYLAVTGLPRWHLVAHAGGTADLYHVVIERNDADIEHLAGIEAGFFSRVLEGKPPPADDLASTTAALRERWPAAEAGSSIDVGSDFVAWVERRAAAKTALDEAERAVRQADNAIKQRMGDAETALFDGEPVVTYRSQHRDGYTVEPSDFRVLRIKQRGTH